MSLNISAVWCCTFLHNNQRRHFDDSAGGSVNLNVTSAFASCEPHKAVFWAWTQHGGSIVVNLTQVTKSPTLPKNTHRRSKLRRHIQVPHQATYLHFVDWSSLMRDIATLSLTRIRPPTYMYTVPLIDRLYH